MDTCKIVKPNCNINNSQQKPNIEHTVGLNKYIKNYQEKNISQARLKPNACKNHAV